MDVVERQEIPQQDAFMAMVERAAALTATPKWTRWSCRA
jgi:isochorismate synthase